MKTLKSLTLAVVLCAFTALMVAILPLGALGYGEDQGFSAQVLLNKPGVTFDPKPLENYANEEGSVIIKVVEPPDYYDYSDDDATYDEPQPGDKNGGGDANDTYGYKESTEAEKSVPPDSTEDTEGGSLEDFMWAPGTYYIYRSHYNSELGVVVSEVEESYAYIDEDSELEVKWDNISGVQVSIVVPTKWEWQNMTYEWRELTVNQSSPLNQTLIDLAVSLGYLDCGGGIDYSEDYYYTEEVKENGTTPPETRPEPVPPTSYNMLYFMKDNLTVMISSGLGGKTSDGPSEANQTWIYVTGMGGDTSKEPYASDIKKMMSHIGISPSLWDGSSLQSYTYPMPIMVPAIDLDVSTIDWPAAMRAELEWLVKEKVVSGLQPADITDICDLTVPSPMWVYDRVMYMDGKWTYGSAFWDGRMPVVEGDGGDFLSAPPPTGSSSGLLSDGNGKESSTNNVGSGAMPMTIFAPGSDSSDNNRMSTMTMVIAIIALCATFLIIIILGVLGFTRLRRNSILDNLNRKNIYEMVKSKPGIHFNELIRTLDMKPGVLSHHLNILESEEYVKSLQDANHRRFYLYGTNTERKIMLTDIQMKILAVVSKSPGISQSSISKTIGRNRMIVNYHIKILRDVNMLQLEKSGRESMCYITDVAKLSLAS